MLDTKCKFILSLPGGCAVGIAVLLAFKLLLVATCGPFDLNARGEELALCLMLIIAATFAFGNSIRPWKSETEAAKMKMLPPDVTYYTSAELIAGKDRR